MEVFNAFSKGYKPKGGDIIFTRVGSFGLSAIVKREEKFCIGQNTTLVLPKKIDPFFIFYFLIGDDARSQIEGLAGGSTQPTISMASIRKIVVPYPPLPEQKAIASVLSSLDDKIDLLHRQNLTLEAMAETLFRQWFVEEAQEDWEEAKLGDILTSIESGSRPKGGIDPELRDGIPSVGAESINGIGNFDFSKTKYVTESFFNSMKRGLIKSHDVLVYKDGAYVGRKGMFGNGFPYEVCSVNEHVFILRSSSRANQFFLYFLLQQDELSQLNANSAQPGLNQEAMKSFEITIPSQNLIDEFGATVKPWVDKIFFNSTQIRIIEKLRDTLLPKLMSGEVRVDYAQQGH